jgi:flagellar biosynthetic protein FliR
MVLLVVSNGYLVVVHGFLHSFDAVGLSMSVKASAGGVVVGAVSTLFVAALEIAAPLLAVLFLVQALLGLLAKAVPQMNIFSFAFPLQIAATVLLLGVAIRVLPTYVSHLVEHIVGAGAALTG